MKKTGLCCTMLAGLAACVLPLTSGCLDCDENGTLESFLICRNRTAVLMKSVEPTDFDHDGELDLAVEQE